MSLFLWMLRHGEAERETRRDPDRVLTAQGRIDATAAGTLLAALAPRPRRLLCSPYVRAQQTATAVLPALSGLRIETVDWLTPDTPPLTALKHLTAIYDESVLLVAHQPLLGDLLGLLIEGDAGAAPPLPTAALVGVDLPITAVGYGALRYLLTPPHDKH
jgi:phosphohistidine phosphatase